MDAWKWILDVRCNRENPASFIRKQPFLINIKNYLTLLAPGKTLDMKEGSKKHTCFYMFPIDRYRGRDCHRFEKPMDKCHGLEFLDP